MISGKYNVYKNGELVASQDNVITNFGKDAIWKYLCGSVADWGGCIAVGAGGVTSGAANGLTVPAITDTKLDFEFSRNNTLLKSPSSPRVVTLKTTLDPSISGTISEVGVYNTTGGYPVKGFDQRILTRFDEGVNASNTYQWSAGSNSSTSYVGSANLTVTNSNAMLGGANDTTSTGNLRIDMSTYTTGDTLQLAVIPGATATPDIFVRLYDTQTPPAYIEYKWAAQSLTSGAKTILTKTLSSTFSTSGTFNWNVSKIYVSTTALSALSFDSLRIDDTDATSTTYGLVSRAALGTPITKLSGDSVDIEYQLTLTL